MSTEKLSELSKPVAWKLHHHDRYYFEENADVVAIAESMAQAKGDPVYSQEYVSALDKVAQYWIGESAGWKKRAEDAEKRIAELERARFIAWPGAMFAPVLARIKVDVKHRDGSLSVGQSAGNVVWYHSDSPSDVVAFALAVEGDEP